MESDNSTRKELSVTPIFDITEKQNDSLITSKEDGDARQDNPKEKDNFSEINSNISKELADIVISKENDNEISLLKIGNILPQVELEPCEISSNINLSSANPAAYNSLSLCESETFSSNERCDKIDDQYKSNINESTDENGDQPKSNVSACTDDVNDQHVSNVNKNTDEIGKQHISNVIANTDGIGDQENSNVNTNRDESGDQHISNCEANTNIGDQHVFGVNTNIEEIGDQQKSNVETNTNDIGDQQKCYVNAKSDQVGNQESDNVKNDLVEISNSYQDLKDKSDDVIFVENEENRISKITIESPKNITNRKRKNDGVDTGTASSPKVQRFDGTIESITLDSPIVSSTTEENAQNTTHSEINASIVLDSPGISMADSDQTQTSSTNAVNIYSKSTNTTDKNVEQEQKSVISISARICNTNKNPDQMEIYDAMQESIILDSPDLFNTTGALKTDISADKMEISDTDSANSTANSTDADAGIMNSSLFELDDYATKTSLDLIPNANSNMRNSVLFVDEIKPKNEDPLNQKSSNKNIFHSKEYAKLNVLCDSNITAKLKTILPSPKHLVVLSDSEGDNTPDQTLTNEALVPELGHEEIHDLTQCDIPYFDLMCRQDENTGLLSLVITRKQLDYSADISRNGSPSSVTSGGMYTLPDKRFSSVSSSTTSSSTTTSNRTTDGSFIIPHPPGSKITHKKHSVKGHTDLYKMVVGIFQNILKTPGIDGYNNCFVDNMKDNNNINNNSNNNKTTSISTPKSSRETNTRNFNVKRADTPTILDRKYKTINSPEMTSNDISKFNRDDTLSIYDDISEENSKSIIKNKQIKKFTRGMLDSPKRTYSPSSKSISSITEEAEEAVGQRVLARWIDKKYYAGRIREVKDFNKFVIQFDDNRTKTLALDYIIFGQNGTLPLCGQSVYAILENDDYEPGIVCGINTDPKGNILYSVIFDRGITLDVEAGEICLTDDQAKALKDQNASINEEVGPSTPRRRTNPNVDLDNIITGPRNRKTGMQKPETPKAGSSGLGKKRGTKSKARHISESSDQSVTEPPSPVDAEDRSPYFIEEVQGVEPELQKTPKKIQGALTGPFPVKGCGRLSGRRSSKVAGSICDNTDPETVELLGPIPTATNFFKNMIFLLTCTEAPKKKISHGTNSGTDSEITCDTDCEDREFINIPFIKERLRSQIEAAGGVVYSHFEDVPNKKYKSCKLIAPRPCHTAKYIQCLASNIPAKTHGWIIRCCKSNRLLKDSNEDLPAGWSIEKKCFIEWSYNKTSRYRVSPLPFNNYLIILCSDNQNFIEFWGRVCKLAGASVRNIDENFDLSGGSAIVTDFDCPIRVKKLAQCEDIPLVSTMWVVQTLIVGQVCEDVNNIKYHHNYTTDTE